MEWVQTTARTLAEAKAQALEQLGVAEEDAEFEILDEPRAGLFGRTRGEARVRARVRPTRPRPKVERRERRPRGQGASETAATDGAAPRDGTPPAPRAPRRERPSTKPQPTPQTKEEPVDAEQVEQEAQRFVAGLVTAFGLTATTSVRREGDDIEVSVDGTDLGILVGPRGSTLQAVQELARVSSQRRLREHDTRLRVDVGGYRERRREALARFAAQVARDVLDAGSARRLEPMSSADRKVIHDVLSSFEGVVTRSEGEEPNRRVVVAPADG